jgi:hypothetical protein
MMTMLYFDVVSVIVIEQSRENSFVPDEVLFPLYPWYDGPSECGASACSISRLLVAMV